MALNKAMQAALKAISSNRMDLKKDYKKVRKIINLTHPTIINPFYKIWDHKITLDDHDIPIRIFSTDEEIKPILLFFHGGGWVTGNIDSYNSVCTNMARITGCRVVSVDYRLAPEYKFPTAPEDCYHAARELFLSVEEYFKVGCEDITLIGDSAGGNLCAAVSLMARDRGEFKPLQQILIYPAVNNDFSENSEFDSIRENGKDYLLTNKRLCDYMDLYQNSEEDRKNPYFAPLIAADFTNLPRTLILTAQYDPLRDEGEAYARKLAEAQNQVECYRIADAVHGYFALSPKYEPVAASYQRINHFLQEGRKNEKK